MVVADPLVTLIVEGDSQYEQVCQFARQAYEKRLSCELEHYYPAYLVYGNSQEIYAVVGMRCAIDEPLFIEHYLDKPIEQLLDGGRTDRADIVELGCFAANDTRSAFHLMAGSAAYLQSKGFGYVVCAANRSIQRCLSKLNIPVDILGNVDPSRVPGGADAWGNYYEGDPRIMAGSIHAGCEAIHLLTAGVAA